MKKRLILSAILACMLFLTGCFGKSPTPPTIENIDKSTQIISTIIPSEDGNYTLAEIKYVMDDKLYQMYFNINLRPALDFLRANSKPSAKVLTWWDNGHSIRGYAKRTPIIYTPCKEILSTVAKGRWDEAKYGPFATKDDCTNVAYALLADSPTITKGIMKRYGAEWAFVTKSDKRKLEGMVLLLGEDMKNYYDDIGEPKEGIRNKVIFKMADGWPLKAFERSYEDEYATVYRLVE
jgi:hypothetical protein